MRGLPPPPQLLLKSFWSDWVDGRKFADQPRVATDGSLERMSSREVNSPDFLAGARTSRALLMEPQPAPKWEKWVSRL